MLLINLIVGFSIGCLIMVVWLAYDMTRWGDIQVGLDIEELELDLYSGLHLKRGEE
jgi:hypothetical protein